tara:strand:- start:74562 stop:74978 length:417 start_codon:yes stop_codon:yes gene_type:complete
MSENTKQDKTLEERIKSLETLQRNTRIAIIILVGYSIYDVISFDSGSEIIYAHKVKAKEFELIDGQGGVYGSWRVTDAEKRTAGLVMEDISGDRMTMTADGIKLTSDRLNPEPRMILNDKGVRLYDVTHSESDVVDSE